MALVIAVEGNDQATDHVLGNSSLEERLGVLAVRMEAGNLQIDLFFKHLLLWRAWPDIDSTLILELLVTLTRLLQPVDLSLAMTLAGLGRSPRQRLSQ